MKEIALKFGGRTVLPKCRLATSFFPRFLGLMGKRDLPGDEAIFFPRCNSIHTFFMRFPIDVIFVSKNGEVLEVKESLGPWRLLLPRWAAAHVIEVKGARARELGIQKGSWLDPEGWA